MSVTSYIVKAGDTLSEIASKYGKTVSQLVELNDITNPDYIVIGQKIILEGPAVSTPKNLTQRAKIKQFGLQSNTDRTVYATWTWDSRNTENYEVKWLYATGDGVYFVGNKSTTEDKQSLYTAPQNANHVAFYVKPISKTYSVRSGNSEKEVRYWTADWSTVVGYNFKDNPPSTPSVPTVTIQDFTLTATLDNLDLNAKNIEFQIVKNNSTVFKTGIAEIKTGHASFSCTINAGGEYKVRCRAIREKLKSDWSDYSDGEGTVPAAPKEIKDIRALNETSVYLDWVQVPNATKYEIEYTKKKDYFDSSNETQKLTVESVVGHAEVIGLETGLEWFFRLRAANDKGNSAWTEVRSIKIGTAPAAPTTWSSTTTVIVGETLNLYWVHNSEDGSSQTYAELELTIGAITTTKTIKNSTEEDEKDKTSSYSIYTSGYTEGTRIKWRVRTRGILAAYGDWSVQRTVDVYAAPTLELSVTNNGGSAIDKLESFPFFISGTPGPNTQHPIGYHVSIASNETYETVDSIGNFKMVSAGDEVYSKYFDVSDNLRISLSAGNVDLKNNVTYTIRCTVSMNSGLTAEAASTLTVAWTDDEYWPNAEIAYDKGTYTTSIRPYCENEAGGLSEGVTLSVYRREFDGSFTELATGLVNTSNTFITDPHPALDYARYRIVAITNATGKVCYYDIPGYPIEEKAVIIQWDEKWSNYDVTEETATEELEQPSWSGSLLRLPYNIDVSDKHKSDVELVEYIGRKYPVSYYGTQLGETSTWNMDIDKLDKETLYALRRLAIWMGDVYVREPSGSGYWANISVSFSQKHCKLTIPVSLEIARVAGGM